MSSSTETPSPESSPILLPPREQLGLDAPVGVDAGAFGSWPETADGPQRVNDQPPLPSGLLSTSTPTAMPLADAAPVADPVADPVWTAENAFAHLAPAAQPAARSRTARAVLTASIATAAAGLLVGAGALVAFDLERRAVEQARFDAAPLCARLAATPELLEGGALGWTGAGATIPESIDGLRALAAEWTALAEIAPSAIADDMERIAGAVGEAADSVESTRTLDAGELHARLWALQQATGLDAWAASTCD